MAPLNGGQSYGIGLTRGSGPAEQQKVWSRVRLPSLLESAQRVVYIRGLTADARESYVVLHNMAQGPVPLRLSNIDASGTTRWGVMRAIRRSLVDNTLCKEINLGRVQF